MAVYVDEIFIWPGTISPDARIHGKRWCHLLCDPGDEDELHALAERIGLRREWFQERHRFSHYDLTPRKREEAIKAGAVQVSLLQWLNKDYLSFKSGRQ